MQAFKLLPTMLLSLVIIMPQAYSQKLKSGKSPQDYKQYQPDFSRLQADKEFYPEYRSLGETAKKEGFKRSLFEKRVALMEKYVNKNPKDVDALWLLTNDIMRLGESYDSSKPDELVKAKESILKAEKVAERCLELRPNFPLCQFFLGAAIGKIATIDGIFASLNKGKKVLNLWISTYQSNMDYQFEDGYALQGLVRYALGIYHRVVPDFFLLRWVFGISGDMDISIAMHQESLAFKGGGGPCGYLELSVSMLCKTKGNTKEPLTAKAFQHLDKVSKLTTNSEDTLICIQDAGRLRQDPSIACGYTKAKQQETDEEAMKAQLDKQRS
ncbi:MAG: hypothetical protein ACOH5I_23820 [Oligoflexus sp.]